LLRLTGSVIVVSETSLANEALSKVASIMLLPLAFKYKRTLSNVKTIGSGRAQELFRIKVEERDNHSKGVS
jgi:hypothetical protein